MKICPFCYRCYEDGVVSCALHPLIELAHERDGTRLIGNKYRLDYRVGRGGNGAVYKCTHIELDQPRAIKLLRPESPDSDPNGRFRLRREALTACRFDHPNVVRIYDFGNNVISVEENREIKSFGELYIVMEFIDGKTLKDFLNENKPVPIEKAVSVAIQISDGLTEIHSQDVILRDLKPENVMLPRDRYGNLLVKLVDFGAVKLSSQNVEQDDADLTRGMFIGTALYASPELCKGDSLDRRSDIYSLGVILYEMLAGQPPFPRLSLPDLLYLQTYAPPPPLTNAPAPLANLVMRALSKDPEERPQSAAEFANSLRAFERSIEMPSSATGTAVPIVSRSKSTTHYEEAHEDEETRVAVVAHRRNSREPKLAAPEAGVVGDKKVSYLKPGRGVKATTKKASIAADTQGHSGSSAKDERGNVNQEKVTKKEGRGPATKTSKPKVGPAGGLRTLAAVILILASLSVSFFLIWSLSHNTAPEATPVEASENSDKPAPSSFSSEVGDELITKTDVNIRVSPSGKSQRIGLAEKGSRVRILAKHKNWREIIVLEHGREKEDLDSAERGWIDGDNLAMAGGGG